MQLEHNWIAFRDPFDANGKRVARVEIDGPIFKDEFFDDTVDPSMVVKQINEIDAEEIDVFINSIGGLVNGGIAIYQALERHSAKINTFASPEVSSIASLIFVGGDHRVVYPTSWALIHKPWGNASGDDEEFENAAKDLRFSADLLAGVYASRSKLSKDDALALMRERRKLGADELMSLGLADELFVHERAAACVLDGVRYISIPRASIVKSNEGEKMPEQTPKPAENPTPMDSASSCDGDTNVIDIAQLREVAAREALELEQARRKEISDELKPFRAEYGAVIDECLNDITVTPTMAYRRVIKAMASKTTSLIDSSAPTPNANPNPSAISIQADARDKFRHGVEMALAQRCRMPVDAQAMQGNEFRGLSLPEIARASLKIGDVRSGHMSRMAMIGMAMTHSGSDFPLILENIASKAILQRWNAATTTYQLWTVPGTLTDFKPASRISMEASPYLRMVPAGGEYRYATIGESGEYIQLATYGALFSIDRQSIINDDTSVFSTIPGDMSEASRRTVNLLVYNTLIDNPPMRDGDTLFHANHGNIGTAGPIDTDSIDEMRTLMATQLAMGTDTAGTSNEGLDPVPLNIPLAYIIVPKKFEGTANTVLGSQYYITGTANDPNRPNSVQNAATTVSDPLLDMQSNDTYWYGASDRRTVEVAFLDGVDTPYLEQQQGWSVDGVQYKIRIDAGVKALDWRGLVVNQYAG